MSTNKASRVLKIGFDGSRAFSSNPTGTENYSYNLLKNLSSIDTENIYLIYIRPGSEVIGDWPENFKFKLINYPRLWTQIGLSSQTLKDKLDLLFIPSHTLPLLKKPGLKTILTVHDLGSEFLPKMHQLKQALYLKLMTHYQLKTATRLIAVSEATKKDIISRVEINPEKISVIYEGVDSQFSEHLKTDTLNNILKKYDIEKGNYFLFVGTIQPRKNLINIIKAFKEVLSIRYQVSGKKTEKHNTKYIIPNTNLKLVLAGSKGWLSEDIYELPKKLGIKSQVKFLGRVPNQDLAALYQGAIALTYPSLFEGFGLPILEAFASGCPVITSALSSMPEVAGEAALLVDPINPEEITKAMQKLMLNDKLRDSLIVKGSKQVKYFSWKKTAEQTLKLFQEVAGER